MQHLDCWKKYTNMKIYLGIIAGQASVESASLLTTPPSVLSRALLTLTSELLFSTESFYILILLHINVRIYNMVVIECIHARCRASMGAIWGGALTMVAISWRPFPLLDRASAWQHRVLFHALVFQGALRFSRLHTSQSY